MSWYEKTDVIMKYRYSFLVVCFLWVSVVLSACKDENGNGIPSDGTPLELVSTVPAEGASCLPGVQLVTFDFAQEVWLLDKGKITVNGVSDGVRATVDKQQVRISLNAVDGLSYTVKLAAGAICSVDGYVSSEDYVLNFTCSAQETPVPGASLSPEAANLLNFLKEQYGKSVLSGAMANVAWNANEAYWVYTKTGKYPAINCVDYVHLYASAPGSWIDYSQIGFLEDWWANNGIVAAMWHWNVPNNGGDGESFYYGSEPENTLFDITGINDPSSEEYARMMADIDKVADYLWLLKQKNIPVIWRPLHEAGGGWFWWGRDAEACKKLWRLMHDRFAEKGLNNLIWVWTLAVAWQQDLSEGLKWYPGDEYVDIIGYDMYNMADAASCLVPYRFMKENWPDKPIAMSECGSIPLLSGQWEAGAYWSWFMPWYDYERTNDVTSAAFTDDSHAHASADWWRAVLEDEHVLTRDELPSLKE